jgi:hypothetical protein
MIALMNTGSRYRQIIVKVSPAIILGEENRAVCIPNLTLPIFVACLFPFAKLQKFMRFINSFSVFGACFKTVST